MLALIPVRSFDDAKRRLAPAIDAAARARLGAAVALRTAQAARAAGAGVAVVTADDAVAAWAFEHDLEVVREPQPGLDAAAAAGVAVAAGRAEAWSVIHADLPLVEPADLAAVFAGVTGGTIVLAPSHDGGSSVVASSIAEFPFAYGPASFHRHLRRGVERGLAIQVVARPGVALDVDTPAHLDRVLALPGGAWLDGFLSSAP